MYICPRCKKDVPKLFPLDDAYTTALHTEAIGIQYPCTNYYCIKCLEEVIGITQEDILKEGQTGDTTKFNIDLFKGRVAQSVVELIFRDCGYEVYPYGYENHLFNIIRHMKKGSANVSARIMRSSPDLFIYDRTGNEGYFLEVKYTNAPDECNYEINKYTLERYREYWEEAYLLIYCVRSGNIYSKPFYEINTDKLVKGKFQQTGADSYILDLKNTFGELPTYFKLISDEKYRQLVRQVKEIFSQSQANLTINDY